MILKQVLIQKNKSPHFERIESVVYKNTLRFA